MWAVYKFVRFLDDLKKHDASQKEERVLLLHGVIAALNGLEQLQANGPVTITRERLEKYLIEKTVGGKVV